MAYGDPYAPIIDLEQRLGRTDDGRFQGFLDAASRAVEMFTRRQFNRDTGTTPAATARRFRAIDPERLPVDDFHTTTDLAVDVDGTAWALTDVEPRPWDGIVNGQNGWPFFDLIAVGRTWPNGRYPKVEITAHWGWAGVPEGIREATLDVAEVMSFGGGGSGSGVVRSKSIDGYSVSYSVPGMASEQAPPELAKAEPYRRKVWGVA